MGIRFEGDPAYQQEMASILSSVESNPVGHIIVTSIRQTGKVLTFAPYDDNDCNATTRGLDASAGAPEGVGGGSAGPAPWFTGQGDDPMTRGVDERFDARKVRATGGGSDVRMKYSPNRSDCGGDQYGEKPDEILLHELVHASRYMQGLVNHIPTADNSFDGYDNEEEFLAIVTTNVYISSKGGMDFRRNHNGHTALDPKLSTSAGFLSDPMSGKLMNIYRLTWTSEFLAISNVLTAKFNPFRELTIRLRDFPVGGMFERMWTESRMPPRRAH